MTNKKNNRKKLAQKQQGPFIVRKIEKGTAVLENVNNSDDIVVRNLNTLSKFRNSDEIMDNEYEVEKIVDHKRRGRGFQYRVRWRGYPQSFDTWLSEGRLKNAQEVLNEYKKKILK